MGFFGKIIGTAIDVVKTPLDVLGDISGISAISGEKQSYTRSRLEQIANRVDNDDESDNNGDKCW